MNTDTMKLIGKLKGSVTNENHYVLSPTPFLIIFYRGELGC
jgi:hypothetical protein